MQDRERFTRATRDAAYMLAYSDPSLFECCGIELTELGTCAHRAYHPTPFNVAFTGYPEAYDEEGKLINDGYRRT